MPVDLSRIDLLVQYALLVAGEEDDVFERQLGPIHLLKYVYLADLAYAQRNNGETFTGIEWKFHHFGPWSNTVHERIAPALQAMGADQRTFKSEYEDSRDWFRWSLQSDELLTQKARDLPASITLHLQPVIRKFGKDTSGLLNHVYRTAPMLDAAPGEILDLTLAAKPKPTKEAGGAKLRMESVSEKKKRAFKEKIAELQKSVGARASRKAGLINPVKGARHDDVYQDGVAWLDELAGEPLTPGEKVAEFSPEVWKSTTRKGSDVP
jgi:hypothetical protein